MEQGLQAYGRQLAQAPATCGGGNSPYGLRTIWDPREPLPSRRGTSVKVCIIDGGVDPTHPELRKNSIEGAAFLDKEFLLDAFGVAETTPWNVPGACAHGVHVTGILASSKCAERFPGCESAPTWQDGVCWAGGSGSDMPSADDIPLVGAGQVHGCGPFLAPLHGRSLVWRPQSGPCLAAKQGMPLRLVYLPAAPWCSACSFGFLNAPGVKIFIAKTMEGSPLCVDGCCDVPAGPLSDAMLACKE